MQFTNTDAPTTGPQGTQGPKLGYNPEKRGEVAKWENVVTGYQNLAKFGQMRGGNSRSF